MFESYIYFYNGLIITIVWFVFFVASVTLLMREINLISISFFLLSSSKVIQIVGVFIQKFQKAEFEIEFYSSIIETIAVVILTIYVLRNFMSFKRTRQENNETPS